MPTDIMGRAAPAHRRPHIPRPRSLGVILFLACLMAPLAAAGAPTALEWKPMEALLATGGPEARQGLAGFMTGRTWPDGWVQLAELDRAAGDFAACREHADLALTQSLAQEGRTNEHRDRVRSEAARLLIHALNRLGRQDEGPAVLARLGHFPDLGGHSHFHLSQGALQTGRVDEAARQLSQAMTIAQGQGLAIPAEYRFHEAAIWEAKAAALRDAEDEASRRRRIEALEAAAASYQRALSDSPEQIDVMFNLARMQRDLARLVPDKRERYLEASRRSSMKLLAQRPDDAEARVGLGLVLLEMGRYSEAVNAFRASIEGLEQANGVRPVTLQTAHRGLGTAILKLAETDPGNWSFKEAYDELEQARAHGDTSPDLYNNLLVAALNLGSRSSDPDERQRFLAVADEAQVHAGGVAPVNLALANYERSLELRSDNDPVALRQAISALDSAAAILARSLAVDSGDSTAWRPEASDEGSGEASAWRYLGHVHTRRGDLYGWLVDGGQAQLAEARDAAWDLGAAAYRAAGDLVDHEARRHFLHLQTRRGAATGYAAAWTMLGWKSYLSMDGWTAAIGNYGGSGSWKQPLHLAIWGVLLGIPLLIALKGLLIGRKVPESTRPGSASRRGKSARPAPVAPPGDEEAKKDATLLPNTMIRSKSGALQKRGTDESQEMPTPGDGQDPAQSTIGYAPSTEQRPQAATPQGGDQPKAQERARAAAQVARRIAQEKAGEPPSRTSRPRRRR